MVHLMAKFTCLKLALRKLLYKWVHIFWIYIYTFKSCTVKPMSYLNNMKKINLHVKENKYWRFQARNYIWQVLFSPCALCTLTHPCKHKLMIEKYILNNSKYILQYLVKILSKYGIWPKVYEAWTLGYVKLSWELYFYVLQQISCFWFETSHSYNEIHRY